MIVELSHYSLSKCHCFFNILDPQSSGKFPYPISSWNFLVDQLLFSSKKFWNQQLFTTSLSSSPYSSISSNYISISSSSSDSEVYSYVRNVVNGEFYSG